MSKPMINNNGNKYEFSLEEISENDARAIASRFIKPNSKILDIGCACGDFGSYIKSKDNFDVYGLEYDHVSIEIARNKHVYEKIEQCDLNFFDDRIFSEHLNSFDYVCLLDVIEHTWDPEKTINYALSFIKPGGHLIISLPNIGHSSIKSKLLNNDFSYTATGILDETHIRFFTYKTIASLMSKINLSIEAMKPKIKVDTLDSLSLPRKISNFILRDKHSYVYQYVILLKVSDINDDVLINNNLKMMNPSVIISKQEVFNYRIHHLINKFFPENSKRKKISKKIYYYLKKIYRL